MDIYYLTDDILRRDKTPISAIVGTIPVISQDKIIVIFDGYFDVWRRFTGGVRDVVADAAQCLLQNLIVITRCNNVSGNDFPIYC